MEYRFNPFHLTKPWEIVSLVEKATILTVIEEAAIDNHRSKNNNKNSDNQQPSM